MKKMNLLKLDSRKGRIAWIDNARGLAIFLVVLGHYVTRMSIGKAINAECYNNIISYATFFVLSGLTLKTNCDFRIFIKKKFIGVLMPTFILLN